MIFLKIREAGLKLRVFVMCILQKTSLIFMTLNFREGYIPIERKGGITSKLSNPRDVTEAINIIGLASYHRKFIANVSDIDKPLTDLTKKNMTYNWSPLC